MIKLGVVVLAAGSGRRMGTKKAKQFLSLKGTMLFCHSLDFFSRQPGLVDWVVVLPPDQVEEKRAYLKKRYGPSLKLVAGGNSRQASVRQGLGALSSACRWLAVQDGARPFISQALMDRLLAAVKKEAGGGCQQEDRLVRPDAPARTVRAVIPCIPLTDTIKAVEGKWVVGTLDRDRLKAAQTPQLFCRQSLVERLETATGPLTDEASLFGEDELVWVAGDPANIKVTSPADLDYLAFREERMREEREEGEEERKSESERTEIDSLRIGSGYDVHAFGGPGPLILGGVRIPYPQGLLAHSDGDLVAHALMDAILGASGLGDIGQHFPDQDPAYKGVSSLELVRRVKELIQADYRIINLDLTILAQAPKLAPYLADMAGRLAGALDLAPDRINLKATTTEKLGFVGRKDGLACQAVCLLQRKGPGI